MPRSSWLVFLLIRVIFGAAVCDGCHAQSTDTATPGTVDPRGIRGACVLGGGGKLPDAIYEQFLRLAGGKQARVLIVPTASKRADTAAGREATLQRWQNAHPGYHFEVLHTRERSEADSEEFASKVRSATAVWFGGGAQSRLAEAYVGTRFEQELHALLQRGGVLGGSSAGTAIQTRTMIARGKTPPQLMTGFDLVPFAIADQHFTQRQRLPRLLLALDLVKGHFGIGIDEGTAIVVQQRSIRVLGKGQAHFVLPRTDARPQRLVKLAAGDHADLPTWQRAARQRGRGVWPANELPPPVVTSGSLILAGGDHLPDAALERFVALAGGASAHIVIVPIATPARARRGDTVQRKLKALGVTDLELLDPQHPDQLDKHHTEMLDRATGVWIDGGRSWRIVDAFEDTAIPAALRRVLDRGGVLGGMANVQGDVLLRGDPLAPGRLLGEGYDRGLGLLPGCAIDDQFHPHRGAEELMALVTRHPQLLGIDLRDHTAAIVTGSTLEVVGGEATIVQKVTGEATAVALRAGDKWDLLRARTVR